MVMPKVAKWTLLVVAFLVVYSTGNESFASLDNYLLACGSSNNITFQGRTFIPDSQHSHLEILANKSVSITSKLSVPSPLYKSARVFSENASYIFRIQQYGRHWIRLYFHPFLDSISNHSSISFASITVVTDSFVLLNNFTFMNYKTGSQSDHLFKEYAINITSDQFSLTFIPHNNSHVFVNAIEVVSIPDLLYPDKILVALNPSSFFTQFSKSALETVYRVNVGGESVSVENDAHGRSWENDENYFNSTTTSSSAIAISTNPAAINHVDAITAPLLVYASARRIENASEGSDLSWVFVVDPNFQYFVRVHFCDINSKSPPNTMVFNLYMNGAFAIRSLDLLFKTKGLAVPYYRDFISHSSGNTLKVSVSPFTRLSAILNGVEIMKISNQVDSLDGFSTFQSFHSSLSKKKKKSFHSSLPEKKKSVSFKPKNSVSPKRSFQRIKKIGIIIGCSAVVLMFLVFVGLSFCYLKSSRWKKKSVTSYDFLRHFTWHEIQQATNDFDPSMVIGEGGFGKVYKGTLENGKTVAIKVANPESRQGLNEFHNEIELLSGLRHQNLVSLVGCCSEDSELILVYNYMANGSLNSHLYGRDFVPLPWKQRLRICLGAAKGLCYLHIGATQSVIHRDVKTSNILLDEYLVPKVADFGISKRGPLFDKSHVTTNVKGSFGYVDPEYFRTKYLTKKSDVYSFGVVLIEVICGKPALDDARPTQQMNLAMWALSCQKKGTFHEMLDPYLIGKVNMDSVNKVSELAWKCLEERRVNRPPIGYVLCELEEALHLELAASRVSNDNRDSSTHANVRNGFADYIEDVA